jgi:hypothetical protein
MYVQWRKKISPKSLRIGDRNARWVVHKSANSLNFYRFAGRQQKFSLFTGLHVIHLASLIDDRGAVDN